LTDFALALALAQLQQYSRKVFRSPLTSIMYVTALTGAVMALAALLPGGALGITIPAPVPHNKTWTVAHTRSSLVDSSRKVPYNESGDRKLAYSLFLPVDKAACEKQCPNSYMPDQTAKKSNLQFFGNDKANFFEQLSFDSCCSTLGDIDAGAYLLVVFEPAVGTSRLVYNQLARQVSAIGTVVVLIDHPYDASVVEFEGSPVIHGTVDLDGFQVNQDWNGTLNKTLDMRMEDVNSIIKELRTTNILERLFPEFTFNSTLNTETFIVMGHGLGGSVATVLSTKDPRAGLSINLAGSIPTIQENIWTEKVFFGRENYTRREDKNWEDYAQHHNGTFIEWTFRLADQMDYTDVPLLVDLVKNPKLKAKGLGEHGPWAFYCTSCFLEAYIRDTIQHGRSGDLTACYRMCPLVEPYSSGSFEEDW
jgi:hypothetical protein